MSSGRHFSSAIAQARSTDAAPEPHHARFDGLVAVRWVAIVLLFAISGCDELGNPTRAATPPAQWTSASAETVTRTETFVKREAIEKRVRRGFRGLHHSDPQVRPDEVLTLVEVTGQLRTQATRTIRLLTVFEMASGTRVAKRWSAPTRARAWRAAFSLPAPPTTAITEVVQ